MLEPSAYLCVPLRLCGYRLFRTYLPQKRRGTQRYVEKISIRPHSEEVTVDTAAARYYISGIPNAQTASRLASLLVITYN